MAKLQAWKYDPKTRTFVRNADGTPAVVHPIDQSVALACTVALGALASAPGTGAKLVDIGNAAPSKVQATVTATIQNALASLIARGDIRFYGATVVVQAPGKVGIAVDYANLRLPKPQRVQLPIST